MTETLDIPRVSDPTLIPLRDKLLSGTPLDADDGRRLFATPDLHGVGRLAHWLRTKLHGEVAYYNRNRHINYTNVCALSCKFCSFYRKRGEAGAYEMPVEQVIATAEKAANDGATEVHIVGGLHPWMKFDYYLDILSGIRARSPELHIKAFTAIEIVHFSRVARLSIRDVLTQLRDAGLGSLPGGGAEIFDERVHDEVFKGKVREDKWFEVHRTAHELGIFSNATMLYGHVEGTDERVQHLLKLRDAQQRAIDDQIPARFNCLIPLSFIPEGSELGHLPGPTGLGDLRTLAVARLLVPNILHIKAFWIMQGLHLAQIALSYGCDDLDGTVVWYDITKREGKGTNHQELHVRQIERTIRDAGFIPTERDTLYRTIERDPSDRPITGTVSRPKLGVQAT